jgi:ferredoxin-type protein NapG
LCYFFVRDMDESRLGRKELFDKGFGYLRKLVAEMVEKRFDLVPRTCLRPPGALVEALFLSTCEGSGCCVRACPYGAIQKKGGPSVHSDATPVIIPTSSPCRLCNDVPCSRSCPSGALGPVERREIKIGLAVVNRETCLAWLGEPCESCVAACPVGREALEGADGRGPVVLPHGCTGCGVCTNVCPVRPRAIRIKPL